MVASPSVDADVDTPDGRSNADPPPEAVVPSGNPGAHGGLCLIAIDVGGRSLLCGEEEEEKKRKN